MKPVQKKAVRASAPRYFRAIDLLLAAVQHTRDGHPVKAAKKLLEAAESQDVDQAMQQLNDQQQELQDQTFTGDQMNQEPQDQMSRTLARLIQASRQQTAEQGGDDADDQDDDETVTDGDDQDEEVEAGMDDDGLDLGMEMDDQDDEISPVEQQVQASVANRLARAQRNKARRA
jgi:hypothetical protein